MTFFVHFFFFVYSCEFEFCEYLACTYIHKCRLKENFTCIHFFKIVQNLKDSQKYAHAKISMFKIVGCRIAFFDT